MLNTDDWYAIQTRPGAESLAFSVLQHKGYELYLPTYKVKIERRQKTTVAEQPLFKGYLFCRCTTEANGRIVTTPGVIGFVRFGNVPATLSDHEIETVRRMVQSGYPVEPRPLITAGTKVRITAGPLEGVEGIYQFEKGKSRVLASLMLLQRSVSVEVERRWIVACDDEEDEGTCRVARGGHSAITLETSPPKNQKWIR